MDELEKQLMVLADANPALKPHLDKLAESLPSLPEIERKNIALTFFGFGSLSSVVMWVLRAHLILEHSLLTTALLIKKSEIENKPQIDKRFKRYIEHIELYVDPSVLNRYPHVFESLKALNRARIEVAHNLEFKETDPNLRDFISRALKSDAPTPSNKPSKKETQATLENIKLATAILIKQLVKLRISLHKHEYLEN